MIPRLWFPYICGMKLRISNQSLRLRINQDDLIQLTALGELKEEFGNHAMGSFKYSLLVNKAELIDIKILDNDIKVLIPESYVKEWNETDKVSFEQQVSDIRILLEKDFQCLSDRPHEDESRNFQNPKSQH